MTRRFQQSAQSARSHIKTATSQQSSYLLPARGGLSWERSQRHRLRQVRKEKDILKINNTSRVPRLPNLSIRSVHTLVVLLTWRNATAKMTSAPSKMLGRPPQPETAVALIFVVRSCTIRSRRQLLQHPQSLVLHTPRRLGRTTWEVHAVAQTV